MDARRHSLKAPAALTSLLEMLAGPALVLEPMGRILAANENLAELARGLGVGEIARVSDLAPRFVVPEIAGLRGSSRACELDLVGGTRRGGRLLLLEDPAEEPLLLLVFEGADTGDESGPTRRMSLLRHDLAGPLTAIIGTAELLLMRETGMEDETREGLRVILAQCARIADLIARDRSVEEGDAGGAA